MPLRSLRVTCLTFKSLLAKVASRYGTLRRNGLDWCWRLQTSANNATRPPVEQDRGRPLSPRRRISQLNHVTCRRIAAPAGFDHFSRPAIQNTKAGPIRYKLLNSIQCQSCLQCEILPPPCMLAMEGVEKGRQKGGWRSGWRTMSLIVTELASSIRFMSV